jgi:hypothetical protein
MKEPTFSWYSMSYSQKLRFGHYALRIKRCFTILHLKVFCNLVSFRVTNAPELLI